ncbi:hypothetical protein HHK36_003937 [Tetracentron sinense]|uniref:Protein CutA, chloroplastic n=1 Tax=Tetracentron sinense TaxID=13715 RepID=A0A835DP19_TETSI|nr:hypothetical protein HHK36_003937 [Tetracentron sinense]
MMLNIYCRRNGDILRGFGVRRRLPLVGAFCMLSLGLSSSSFKTGCAQSLPFASFLRSRLGYQSIHSTRMEGNNSTVPSIVVYVTVPNKEAENDDGKPLLELLEFGKVDLVSASSVLLALGRDEGKAIKSVPFSQIQTDSEELLIIKTRESLLEALTEHVKANHEYDVPEVIALPITGGSLQYLEWIKNSTRD